MHLETERIILRDFNIHDLKDFHEIFSDPEVMKYAEPPYDLKKSKKFLKEFCIKRNPKGGYAVEQIETGKVIGYVLFCPVDEPEVYEIGWIFNKNYWRKGYAYEICSRLIKYGFEAMELHKIYANAIDTDKSVSLMKKLQMQFEGIQKKHTKNNEGRWCDLHSYAILGEDYFLVK